MKANLLSRVLAAKATAFVDLTMMIGAALGAASTAQEALGDPLLSARSQERFHLPKNRYLLGIY
jgi:hypothetical protein